MDHIVELNAANVHIRDVPHVEKVLRDILADGPDKLQVATDFDATITNYKYGCTFAQTGPRRNAGLSMKVLGFETQSQSAPRAGMFPTPDEIVVADFDRTLSKYTHRGKVCATCHNVLEEGHVLPDFYKEKARAIRDYYFPIEMDPNLTIEEKTPKMIEWWTKAHDLMMECHIVKDDIRKMVKTSTAKLRDGCDWFFDELHRTEIPVLIFSAGVGDVIEEIIHEQSKMYDNMHIVSNYMDFNEEGKMVGWKADIIHVFNKNENAIHNSDYFQNLVHRNNVILMGDSLGDLHMADGVEDVKNKLKIGFLNTRVEDSLELYKSKFDIVIVQDESLQVVNAILRKLLEDKAL